MSTNEFAAFSDGMAAAAEAAGAGVVLVNGRRRFPASGVLVRAGVVLTADHVLERDDEIRVGLADGSVHGASVVGRDPGTDLAVLKLDSEAGSPLAAAEIGARIGELVLALGRPAESGLQASLGVVSAVRGIVRMSRGRRRRPQLHISSDPFIYTDAVPYPGFSGGPLVNASGQMLGLNTSGLGHGSSLAIPAGRAHGIAEVLLEHGSVRRGYLGVRSQLTPLEAGQQAELGRPQEAGLLVVWIEPESPAAKAGLIVGDILAAVNGETVDDHESLQEVLGADLVDQQVEMELLRGGSRKLLAVTVGAR